MLESTMLAIYFAVTAYLFVCNSPPQIGIALRDAVSPFQIIARARKAGAERSAAARRFSQFESRAQQLSILSGTRIPFRSSLSALICHDWDTYAEVISAEAQSNSISVDQVEVFVPYHSIRPLDWQPIIIWS